MYPLTKYKRIKVSGTLIITLKSGERALILLAENKIEQEKLYYYLSIDAYKLKNEISEEALRIDFIAAGFKGEMTRLFGKTIILLS